VREALTALVERTGGIEPPLRGGPPRPLPDREGEVEELSRLEGHAKRLGHRRVADLAA
jgi:hypothetical protein